MLSTAGPENSYLERKAWMESKTSLCRLVFFEASTGFEPVMRVLQTLALPLGHDARTVNLENQD